MFLFISPNKINNIGNIRVYIRWLMVVLQYIFSSISVVYIYIYLHRDTISIAQWVNCAEVLRWHAFFICNFLYFERFLRVCINNTSILYTTHFDRLYISTARHASFIHVTIYINTLLIAAYIYIYIVLYVYMLYNIYTVDIYIYAVFLLGMNVVNLSTRGRCMRACLSVLSKHAAISSITIEIRMGCFAFSSTTAIAA